MIVRKERGEEFQATPCQQISIVCSLPWADRGRPAPSPTPQHTHAHTHLCVIFPFAQIDSGKTNHLGRLPLLFPLLELEVSPCPVPRRWNLVSCGDGPECQLGDLALATCCGTESATLCACSTARLHGAVSTLPSSLRLYTSPDS